MTCDRIADSCGYAVPLMDYVGDRDLLDRSQERRDDAYYERYWARAQRDQHRRAPGPQ